MIPTSPIGLREVLTIFKARMGSRMDAGRIHAFVNRKEDPLPAWENALRKNNAGEPTLLFDREATEAWLTRQIRPVTPARR